MRVSDLSRMQFVKQSMGQHAADLNSLYRNIASGIKIHLPSDNPTSYLTVLHSKLSIQNIDAIESNINDAKFILTGIVDSLQDINNVLVNLKGIATTGIDTTLDLSTRVSLANQVEGAINQLLNITNRKVGDNYIFSGINTLAKPFKIASYTSDGFIASVVYQGIDQNGFISTVDDYRVPIYVSGNRVVQDSGFDIFQEAIVLRDTLRSSTVLPTDINNIIHNLEKLHNHISELIGYFSTYLSNIDSQSNQLANMKLFYQEISSFHESTEYSSAIVDFFQQQNLLQASMFLAARQSQMSLLDYLV